jgi:hypothetical protein
MKKITFNVIDIANVTGFFNVTIPKQFLGGPYIVHLDDIPITATSIENATHTFIYATYTVPSSQNTLRAHTIDIVGTIVYSTLSCSTSSDSLTTDDSTTIFGTITPAISTEVTLQITTNGEAAWNNLTIVNTTSDGAYSYRWNPSLAGTYTLRATWSGDSNYYSATSSVTTLTVKNFTTINCHLSQASPTLTDTIIISGAINPPRSGVPITLYYRNNPVWNILGLVTSTSDGTYSYSWISTKVGSYLFKASWAGDTSFGGATSNEVPLTVSKTSTSISCSVSSSEVTEGASVTVSGALNLEVSDTMVTLTYQKPDGSTVTRTVTTGANGSYSDSYQPEAEGSWSVTVTWDGDATHDGAASTLVSFTVKTSGCLIATATYGSELSPQVQFLREFRDNTVLTTFSGSSFMTVFNEFYYSFSPNIASHIIRNPLLRDIMKGVLYPLMGILRVSSIAFSLFYTLPELGIVITGILTSSLIGLVYFLPLMLLLFFIKKFYISIKILHLLGSIWVGNFIFLIIAEISKLPLMMMVTTGTFVLVTLFFVTLTSLRLITNRLC